ncbi:hypothetical protein [Natranaerobius thermophilus]|uniref:Uncharacterized protein n=1 Tax=Natranaerobius thermophilus (strain ATCC BAA-1301 / DSM 18059 / JW/NM-WN-LF) TaxID=457570 RepID=B2A1D4_NATTJ|nr:hypothetical protein [Natranaerobius thermophilus]ACB86072.1 hypothetical protein Nther_2509 [Natranaerobius thermophilus JW/NM-WN-LF]
MDRNQELEYRGKLRKIMNRYLDKSRKFCEKYSVPDGLLDIMTFVYTDNNIPSELLYSAKLFNDFDYFVFSKSTKTLHAIRALLNEQDYHFDEDIMMLVRSIFEGHLFSRYFRDKIDDDQNREELIEEFIRSPIGVITDYFSLKRNKVIDQNSNLVAERKGPSKVKQGKDENYYYYFYSYLCEFTHSNFGTMKHYFNGTHFIYDKQNLLLEPVLFSVFAFTKVFEGIATVQGENFETFHVEKSYYELVYDALDLQAEIFDYLIDKYKNSEPDKLDWIIQLYLSEGNPKGRNDKMVKMMGKMKNSLYEEIGSLKKNKQDNNGYLIRQYPYWD